VTSGGRPESAFGVETIELDLPPLVGAFARRLRAAGLPVTPGRSTEFAQALSLVRPVARARLYWTARAIFVSDQVHVRAFDAAFSSIFGGRTRELGVERGAERIVPSAPDDRSAAPPRSSPVRTAGGDAVRGSFTSGPAGREPSESEAAVDLPLAIASDEERLRQRSFDALEPRELVELHRLMSQLRLATPARLSRRYERGRHGEHVDVRRTLRGSLRTAGDPIRLRRRRRRTVRRRLVMLCDISGSMEPYARAYLQFLACASSAGPSSEAFVFATRLTRVTRALASRNPDRAMRRAAAAAPDWSSGTRIGDALREFNDRHGRRGMARGAVVVILSDGWERGDPALVGREMERLRRLAHRIVWVNPRAGARGFAVRSGGMVAALPHCDALVSGHSFDALGEVVEAIGIDRERLPGPPAMRTEAPEADEVEEEPWPSATPVPGSSVAMPSGYGPSRGNTTPGWSVDR
jgi:hypothetical protein